MKSFMLLACTATAMLLITSCGKKDDEAPVITVNSPADESVFEPGAVIRVDVTYTDNEELSQWNLDIHEAGGHNHGKTESEWEVTETGDISGKSETVIVDVTVPADAEHAAYHFTFSCLDEEGNQSEETIEIDIE